MSQEFEYQPDDSVHNHPFTIVYNELIESNASPEAFRLITYMISKPKGWVFHTHKLQEICQCGERKFKDIIKEVKDLGYMRTIAIRDANGDFRGSKRLFAARPIYKVMEGAFSAQSPKCTVHKPHLQITNTERLSNTERTNNTRARAPATLNTKEIDTAKAFVAVLKEGEMKKVCNGTFTYEYFDDELTHSLGAIDVSNARANALIAKYGRERIKEALEMTNKSAKSNPAAYFNQCLAHDWKPSTGKGAKVSAITSSGATESLERANKEIAARKALEQEIASSVTVKETQRASMEEIRKKLGLRSKPIR